MNKRKLLLSKINIIEKILIVLFLFIILRLFTYKLHFIDTFGDINVNFLLITIFINIFLIDLIYRIFIISNINITKREFIILVVLSVIIIGLSSFEIMHRHMLYYQDNVGYYAKQMALRSIFINNSLFETIKIIIGDIWYSDYGCFLNLFLELTNVFTSKTIDSYVIATIILIIPYLLVSLYGLIKYIFNTTDKRYWLLLLVILLMPLLFCNLLEGMPDVFGLVFVNLIIILTINYDFRKIDIERLCLLGIITFFLIICRRWYLYFILSYYIIYVVLLLLPLIIKKDFKSLKIVLLNGIKFAFIYGILLVIVLYPMIMKIITANYKETYVAYKLGDLRFEFNNQLKIFGLLTVLLSIIGYLTLIRKENKKYRNCLILFFTFFLTIILFNTVQNFGVHHMLMLIPSVMLGVLLLLNNLKEKKYKTPLIALIILLLINFIYSIDNKLKDNIFFTNISMVKEPRSDIEEVKMISRWIIENTTNEKMVYVIPHSFIYNPDIFKFALAPNIIDSSKLPYGSAMLGSHKFPVELFYANYVLTSTPFTGYSISYKYDEAFMNSPFLNTNFKLIKEVDMHNGYIFKIYERIGEASVVEVNYYLDYFKEENEKYYNLYGKVIEEYLNDNLGKEVNNE